MINYYRNLEQYFWDNWEEDDLIVNDDNFDLLDRTLQLMELNDEDQANQIIEKDETLREMFGPKFKQSIMVLEHSDPSDWESSDVESLEELVHDEPSYGYRVFPTLEVKQEDDIPESSNARDRKRTRTGFDVKFDSKSAPSTSFGFNSLNIDCDRNRKQSIERWLNEISLLIQTQPDSFDTPEKVILLAEHKSTGNLNKYIKNITWNTKDKSPTETLDIIATAIFLSFLGVDLITDRTKEAKAILDKAEERMTKMTLCDICYLESFYCDYEKSFFELREPDDLTKYVQLYLRKIPIVGEICRLRYDKEGTEYTKHSLAFAHKIVKEEITKICNLSKTQKKLKKFNKNCCPKLIDDYKLDYGCKDKTKKKKIFKYEKKRSVKRRFSKRYVKKPFTPSKFARKPSKKTSGKEKFCPKGKKSCRCWICSEEGHYANECPNKDDNKKQFKLFQEVINQGLIPIEDPYGHEHHVYEFYEEALDPDGSTEYSSSESSDSSSESD